MILCVFGMSAFVHAGSVVSIVDRRDTNHLVTVHFINVGQGDATFIDYGDYEILIDAGTRENGETVINYIQQYVNGKIELVIATHPDADHIAGLISVLNTFVVEQILYNGESKDTQTFRDAYNAAIAEDDCLITIAKNDVIHIDDNVVLQILSPEHTNADTNENSIIAILQYDEVSVLLPGDMGSNEEQDLMHSFFDIDVLKAPHHGSKYSANTEFLHRVKPEHIIISAGANNIYDHPHSDALQRFFDIGTVVYGTFKDGNVVMSTDGISYHIDAETKLTIEDGGDSEARVTVTEKF